MLAYLRSGFTATSLGVTVQLRIMAFLHIEVRVLAVRLSFSESKARSPLGLEFRRQPHLSEINAKQSLPVA